MFEKLLKPRPITQWVLVALGFSLGYFVFLIAPEKIQAWISGLVAPFCVMCATVIWAMREKIDDVINLEELEPEKFDSYINLINSHRIRSLKYTISTLFLSLGAAMPTIAVQVGFSTNIWMCAFAGASVGASIYNVLIANSWDEKFRAERNKSLFKALKNKRKKDIEEELDESDNFRNKYADKVGPGWKDGGEI